MLEFAIVGPIFFAMLFAVFEISYDLFLQEVLDNALQLTVRQVQVGNTQSATASNFVSSYFCPNAIGLLNCGNVYVRVEQVSFGTAACTDYYDATSGDLPVVNGSLQLGLYYSGAGSKGLGSNIGTTGCDDGNTSYVTAPSQACMMMTAIYLAPSFLTGLLPNTTLRYNGKIVRVQYSTAAFITEPYSGSTTGATC